MNSYCNKIRPLISEYIDDALDPRRSVEIDRHLASCPDCRQIADDFRANKSVMASMPLRQTSSGFDAALAQRLAAINQQKAKRSWLAGIAEALRPSRSNVWRPAFATMTAVTIVGSTIFALRVQTPPPTVRPTTSAAELALIQQCVVQHRSYAEAQPLNDLPAQLLAQQVDNSKQFDGDDDDVL